MTNAEKIRSMKDEELENFIFMLLNCGVNIARETSDIGCRGCVFPFCEVGIKNRVINWLKSEVEE